MTSKCFPYWMPSERRIHQACVDPSHKRSIMYIFDVHPPPPPPPHPHSHPPTLPPHTPTHTHTYDSLHIIPFFAAKRRTFGRQYLCIFSATWYIIAKWTLSRWIFAQKTWKNVSHIIPFKMKCWRLLKCTHKTWISTLNNQFHDCWWPRGLSQNKDAALVAQQFSV